MWILPIFAPTVPETGKKNSQEAEEIAAEPLIRNSGTLLYRSFHVPITAGVCNSGRGPPS